MKIQSAFWKVCLRLGRAIMNLWNKAPLGFKLLLVAVVYGTFGFIYARGHYFHAGAIYADERLLYAAPEMLSLLFVVNFLIIWRHQKSICISVRNVSSVAIQSLFAVLGAVSITGIILANLYGK